MKHPAVLGNNVKFVVADDEGANYIWNAWGDLIPSSTVVQMIDTDITGTVNVGMIDSESIYHGTLTHFIGEHTPVFAVL